MPSTRTTPMPTADAVRLLLARDAALIDGLRTGDPTACDGVARALRMTPLSVLAAHPSATVEALAALPDVARSLLGRWEQQDLLTARRLAMWAEQARRHQARRHQARRLQPAA